jgi:acetyl-CoA carboxylase alpha subunit
MKKKLNFNKKNQDLENAIDSLEKSQQEYKKQCSKLIETISNTIEEQTKTLNTSISNIIKEVGI